MAMFRSRIENCRKPSFHNGLRPAYLETERAGFDPAPIRKLLRVLYLQLKASDFKELSRLVDVLKLHGFLLSYDAP